MVSALAFGGKVKLDGEVISHGIVLVSRVMHSLNVDSVCGVGAVGEVMLETN